MNEFRTVANIILFLALVLWGLAFFFGPENIELWKAGKIGAYGIILGALFHVFGLIAPSHSRNRGTGRSTETRKCTICGRPSIPGSIYCKYHTDEMRQRASEKSNRPRY